MIDRLSPSRGRFITLEGIEGVGKSTNVSFVAELLRNAGYTVQVTREPGGVPLAERVRELLLDARGGPVLPMCELLLMFAARAAHLEQRIRPALESGQWVVCDRFTDASYAYQGGGRGLPDSAVAALEQLVQGSFRPDLTILLDADWAATRGRRAHRGVTDRFEQEDQAFFKRVRAAYLERAQNDANRVRLVDATAPLLEVQAHVKGILSEFLRGST